MVGHLRRDVNDQCLRIGFWNCGGLPLNNRDLKNNFIREWITELKWDIVGLSEVNVHWKLLNPTQRLPERTFGWFESLHLSLAYLHDWPAATASQVGGSLVWSINRGAHRVMEHGFDSTLMGRWCWTRYRGRGGRTLRVISAYRCVDNQMGPLSAWSQQRRILDLHHIEKDPREAFVDDLVTALSQWMEQGDMIVLGIDLNEPIGQARFTSELARLGIVEILSYQHSPTPPSYSRGSTTIDGLYVSRDLQESSCGFLPMLNDHRPVWIDIPFQLVFGADPPHVQRKARRLKLQDPRVVSRYLLLLSSFVEEHHLLVRSRCLAERTDFFSEAYQQEYQQLDSLRTQGMQWAESKCRKLRMGRLPFSLEYKTVSRAVLIWRLFLKWKRGGSVDSRFFHRQLKLANTTMSTLTQMSVDEIQQKVRQSYKQLNDFSEKAEDARDSWLQGLLQARADASGLTIEQEQLAFLQKDKQRRSARIIRTITKSGFSPGLSMVQVKATDLVVDVTSKGAMEEYLQAELAARFHQASHTPFASDPLFTAVGPFGTTAAAQQILEGTYICPPEVDYWTTKLIPFLQYIPSFREVQESFPLYLSGNQHDEGWKRMRENVSSGYSRLSFAQFKAATQDPDISEIDSILADLPYRGGFSVQRWQHGVDVMIEKKAGNFMVDKLRAILLYEADFNQNNKRFGRDFMRLAELHNALAPEQFGSRNARSAVDQSLNKALTFDIWRQFRMPGALCSNDAKSCYDRIIHNFASLCLQRVGAPVQPIVSMFTTIQQLQHHTRTVHGDSSNTFSGAQWVPPIHGVGQGNGAGPQIWAAVSTPILNMLRAEKCGSFFRSAISQQEMHFVGYAFVDDTDLVSSHHDVSDVTSILENIQLSVNAWQGGIFASGGAIVPEKSHWYLVDFEWNAGIPKYRSNNELPGEIQVLDADNIPRTLKRLEPSEAERTLGVRLAPDGNMLSQVGYMVEKVTDWCNRIRNTHLPRHLVHQALMTTLMKTLEYPLPCTVLTETQCNQVMSPVFQVCLPLLGFVRTFPQAILYATHTHAGLQMPNLYWLQGYYHIDRLIRFHKASHFTGQLLRHSLEALRIELGCNGNLLALPYHTFGVLASATWVSHTWKFISEMQLSLSLDVPEFLLQRENDLLLIPLFGELGYLAHDLVQLNRCRIFLKVISLSDIVSGCGTKIRLNCWNGVTDALWDSSYQWPRQTRPPEDHWITWRKALSKICSRSNFLRSPLGQWLPAATPTLFFERNENRIYRRTATGCFFYRTTNQRASRQSMGRFGFPQPVETIPTTATPATAYQHGSMIYLTGSTRQLPKLPATAPSFLDLIRTSAGTDKWALSNVEFRGDYNRFISLCSDQYVNFLAVSDGSYKDQHGTASWRISIMGESDYLTGSSVVPGCPEIQSAYRSELFGLYGISITLWAIRQSMNCSMRVEIGCDGQLAITQCSWDTDILNPSISHYDLIFAVRWILSNLNGYIAWRHIKGHQDQGHDLADLDIWARFNIQMDECAKTHWRDTISKPRTPDLSFFACPPMLHIQDVPVVTELKQKLMQHLGSQKAIPYWNHKFKWGDADPDAISWRYVHWAASALPLARRTWLSKHLTGFFATGKNMVRWGKATDSSCPRCATSLEDKAHIIQCPGAAQLWTDRIASLETTMLELQTPYTVARFLASRLKEWWSNQILTPIPTDIPLMFQSAFHKQDAFGWQTFLDGFLVSQWACAMDQYLRSIQSKVTIRRWMTAIIRKLWEISWDLWEQRNDHLHRRDESRLVEQLDADIRAEFQLGPATVPRSSRNLFTDLQSILVSPIPRRKMWLGRVIAARARYQQMIAQGQMAYASERRFLHRWLQRR